MITFVMFTCSLFISVSYPNLTKSVDRYQYDVNAPGAAYQLRLTCTRELNLNVSVSNANMMLQAYASWNNLSQIHESSKKSVSFGLLCSFPDVRSLQFLCSCSIWLYCIIRSFIAF